MKRQIRRCTFETNSSSTHSLSMCSKEEFEKWENGELLFNEWSEEFVSPQEMSDRDKQRAEQHYEDTKNEYSKNWSDLSDEAKKKYYKKYAIENDLIDEDAKTYEEWENDGYLETFVKSYETKSGDTIFAFGKFGYDG